MARAPSKEFSSKKAWFNHDDWSDEFAGAVVDRFEAAQKRLESSKKHNRIQRAWRTFYMRDQHGSCDTTEIGSAGRKGEVLLLQPNRWARLVRDHVTMVQQTKSLPEPMAANSDPDCQEQVALAKGVIEHYKREADLEGVKTERAFVAELCGDSYLHVQWDPDLGNEVAVEDLEPAPANADEETAEPVDDTAEEDAEGNSAQTQRIVYEGDFRFSVRSPYEIAYDRTSPDPKKPRWWIVKEPINRFDLLAQVQEEVTDKRTLDKLEKAIRSAKKWTEFVHTMDYDDTVDEYDDSIPIYFVYVEGCRARASGRFAKIIDRKTVLLDSPMPEPRSPVFRLSQGEVLFRNESTTANHDGLPLMDALGAQLSTILSNHANYGLQRIIAPRKANLLQTQIDTGAAVVEFDHIDDAGQQIPPPSPWNMLAPGSELYEMYQLLCSELDLVMAGSPVTRGDPKATQGDSGSKVAALFAAAQNIGSSFVAAVIRSEEELYTFLIDSLKRHATTKRVVSIVGTHNSFAAKEYTGQKLMKIIRVAVQQADAMRDTLPGRMAMVELLQNQSPEQQRQTIAVMSTGRLESITDPFEDARLLLERENEDLRNPEAPLPIAMKNDQHADHWKSHMDQANDPDVRRDPVLAKRIETHNRQHEAFLTPGSPVFDSVALMMTGQKPLPPPEAQQSAEPNEAPGPNAGPPGPSNPQGAGAQGHPGSAPQPTQGMPRAPRLPTNPVTGQPMSVGGNAPARPAPSPTGLGT